MRVSGKQKPRTHHATEQRNDKRGNSATEEIINQVRCADSHEQEAVPELSFLGHVAVIIALSRRSILWNVRTGP